MVVDQVKWLGHGADVDRRGPVGIRGDVASISNEQDEPLSRSVMWPPMPRWVLILGGTSVYFQSRRPVVQRLGFTLGMQANLSELEAIYGFDGSTNLAHVKPRSSKRVTSSILDSRSTVVSGRSSFQLGPTRIPISV